MREAALRGQARAYYELMSPAERAAIAQRSARLERDPSPDGRTTFAHPDAPGLLVYDGTWQMIYTVPDDATVIIRSIGQALDLHRD